MSVPIYVVDTNILIDYPNIIPNGNNEEPEKPSIDLSHAHIVIPTAVVRELSSFKKESTNRGKASRTVLKRLRKLVENSKFQIDDFYAMDAKIQLKNDNQWLSILPIPHNIPDKFQFHPSSSDMDGQIILTALFAKILNPEYHSYDSVVLLTNDNGLAIRATARGIRTARYSYEIPNPYTGRRDLIVETKLFNDFWNGDYIDKSVWDEAMPEHTNLAPNEFIVMTNEIADTDSEIDPRVSFRRIGRYDADSERIVHLKYFYGMPIRPKNAGQAIFMEALTHPDISAVICTGPAGTGKTFIATVYAYEAAKSGQYMGIAVVPCRVEDDGVGYLPGDLNEKLNPNVQPIKNSIRNYLLHNDKDIRRELQTMQKFGNEDCAQKGQQKSLKARLYDQAELIWDNWFGEPIPIAYARGMDFPYQIALYDEFQDQNRIEAKTLLTRLGEYGKIVITGDVEQIHSPYLDRENNGLTYARNTLRGYKNVAQVTFTPNEIVRHPLIQAMLSGKA